jgi:hypothetical protein
MGRGGIYYRQSLDGNFREKKPKNLSPDGSSKNNSSESVNLAPVESGDVREMRHSSSDELLMEINKNMAKLELFPLAIVATVGFIILLVAAKVSLLTVGIMVAVSVIILAATYYKDLTGRTIILLYDLDERSKSLYGSIYNAGERLAKIHSCWHIEATGEIADGKYYAGASTAISRKKAKIEFVNPKNLRSNIRPVSFVLGNKTIYFYPDRMLFYDKGRVGAVGYEQLTVKVEKSRFIEHARVPPDSTVVGKTWQFVNKKGGPDLRFSNNQELPICLYEEIHLQSSTGLNELLQFSNGGIGDEFKESLEDLQSNLFANRESAKEIVFISQNGVELGRFSLAEVYEFLCTGALSWDDYFFDQTENQWKPLKELEL